MWRSRTEEEKSEREREREKLSAASASLFCLSFRFSFLYSSDHFPFPLASASSPLRISFPSLCSSPLSFAGLFSLLPRHRIAPLRFSPSNSFPFPSTPSNHACSKHAALSRKIHPQLHKRCNDRRS